MLDALGRRRRIKGVWRIRADGYVRKVDPVLKKRMLEHVAVWIRAFGPVPLGYEIHHKNGIRSDNRLENLEILTPLEHGRLHSGCTKLKTGDWLKPCNTCNETKSLTLDFYKRANGSPLHECKKCTRTRTSRDKRIRKCSKR